MRNFLQHEYTIIENFCNAFKKDAFKNIWGIDLNCNVKNLEDVWLDKQMLDYQILSESVCASGCTVINPSFLITDYPAANGTTPFPLITCFNPALSFSVPQPEIFSCGSCCTKVQVTAGSVVKTYHLTVCSNMNSCTGADIVPGTTSFTYLPIVGFNIELSLIGYGFLTPGVNYSFNTSTGTITLLGGLQFNALEVYTIFAYS